MLDLHSEVKYAQAIPPASYTGSQDGATLDRKGYDAVTFVVQTGLVTTASAGNGFSFAVEEGDDSTLSDAAAAAAADIQGSITSILDQTAHDNKFMGKVTYRGSKRYCRLVATKVGTTTAIFGAIAALWNPGVAPVSNDAPA